MPTKEVAGLGTGAGWENLSSRLMKKKEAGKGRRRGIEEMRRGACKSLYKGCVADANFSKTTAKLNIRPNTE